MKEYKIYEASDGKKFNSKKECKEYEKTNYVDKKVVLTLYANGSKENNYEAFEDQGIVFKDSEAERLAAFALYDLTCEVEIDLATGESKILAVNGKKLI
jgi:hypothetical protein